MHSELTHGGEKARRSHHVPGWGRPSPGGQGEEAAPVARPRPSLERATCPPLISGTTEGPAADIPSYWELASLDLIRPTEQEADIHGRWAGHGGVTSACRRGWR